MDVKEASENPLGLHYSYTTPWQGRRLTPFACKGVRPASSWRIRSFGGVKRPRRAKEGATGNCNSGRKVVLRLTPPDHEAPL